MGSTVSLLYLHRLLFYYIPYADRNKQLECQRRHYRRHAEREKERSRKRRKALREWYSSYKSKISCVRCGETHSAAIGFHHIEPKSKVAGISDMVKRGFSKAKIIEEIDKCIPLCSNCHRKLHYALRIVNTNL